MFSDNQPLNLPQFSTADLANEAARILMVRTACMQATVDRDAKRALELAEQADEMQRHLNDMKALNAEIAAGKYSEYDRNAPTDDLPENLRIDKEEISRGILDTINMIGRKARR